MTISSEINEQLKFNADTNKLEFQNFTEIYFPHICIICRNHADKHIAKNSYGLHTSNKDYKKNYTFSLPVCDSCRNHIEMKTGISSKSGKLLLISSILGTIIAFILFLTLYSILLSLSIFAISITFPARNYKIKTKSKIHFDNHLKIKVNPKNPDIVELEFSDKEYAKALEEINLSKLKLKQEQEVKKKQEQEAKKKQEQEAKLKQEQEARKIPQQIPESTEPQPIDINIENEKPPVEMTITEPVSRENNGKEQIPDSTEPHPIGKNIENEKTPVKMTITEPVSGENNSKEQIPDSTEPHPIGKNIENEKTPVEITITEPSSGENTNKEQRKNCPKCKMEIKSEWVFCDNCGTPLKK